MVINTDLAYHFELVTNVQAKMIGENFPQGTLEDHLLFLTFTLHCADLSKPARPLATYLAWMDSMTEEFWLQGDMEKELGIPVSSFMDRDNPNKERQQITYIDFIVRESIDILNLLSPNEFENAIERDLITNGLNNNRKNLQKKIEGEVKI